MLRHAAPVVPGARTRACTDSAVDQIGANSSQACGHCLASSRCVSASRHQPLNKCYPPIVEHVRPDAKRADVPKESSRWRPSCGCQEPWCTKSLQLRLTGCAHLVQATSHVSSQHKTRASVYDSCSLTVARASADSVT
jgi:hypothetical protein